MVCTNDPEIHKRALHLKGQGLAENRQYWHDIVGYNYRMTNICAAIGLAQLERAEEFIAKKQQLAKWYSEELAGLPIEMQKESPDISNTYWMVSILVSSQTQRDGLRKHLEQCGIETRPLFFPVHEMPMYLSGTESFPVAENLSSRGINLPSYPGLTLENVRFMGEKIREYFLNYKKG
jgi:perosamine synthetase